jgi:hypothetical protein
VLVNGCVHGHDLQRIGVIGPWAAASKIWSGRKQEKEDQKQKVPVSEDASVLEQQTGHEASDLFQEKLEKTEEVSF